MKKYCNTFFALLIFCAATQYSLGQCYNFSGLDPSYCSNSAAVTLIPNQPGGVFTGPGISGTTFDPAVAGPGAYVITYTIATGGCNGSSSQPVTVVAAPTVNAGPDLTVCPGDSIQLQGTGAGGATYAWSPTQGLSNPNILQPNASPSVTTTYTLTGSTAGGPGGGKVYMRSTAGQPWGMNSNEAAMDVAFGVGGWLDLRYENDPAPTVFNPSNRFVFMEGGDFLATEMETYFAANQTTIENWVSAGGALFINAAPNEDNGMSYGFGGIDLVYQLLCTTSNAVNPAHPIFIGPYTPVVTNYTGNYYFHAYITGPGLTNVIEGCGVNCASEKTWGNGIVMFGGMTHTDWHSPNPEAFNLRCNILFYLNGAGGVGCSSTDDATVTIATPPNANFTGLNATYCASDLAVTLTPVNGGGVFSGTGIVGNTFDPSVAGPGTYTITYTLVLPCNSDSSQTVTVLALPDASFSGLSNTCITSPSQNLVPTVAGGTFSGPGVTGNIFDPALAGIGTHTITYNVTAGSCSNSSSQNVTVYSLPDGAFTGLGTPICENGGTETLVPNQPGGVFSGPGMVGNVFNPDIPGPGTYNITYDITLNGCSASSMQTVVVNPVTPVNISGLASDYCIDGTPVTVTGNPAGGIFTGPGMSGNTFSPVAAGQGNHTITYTYTNGYGCISSTTASTTVNVLPVVDLTFADPVICQLGGVFILTGGTPSGGNFSGNGVNGNTFDPVAAGLGTHTITYTYTNGNTTCTSSDTDVLTVVPNPTISLGADRVLCAGYTMLIDGTTPGMSYNWSTTETTPTITVTTGGTYSITITDVNSCTATDNIVVTLEQNPVVELGPPQIYCEGVPATFDAGNPGMNYYWFSGQNTQTITVNVAGTYYVTVTSSNGCWGADDVYLGYKPDFVVNLGPDISECANQDVVLNAGVPWKNYSWSNGFITQTFHVEESGTYSVTVSDECYTHNDTVEVNLIGFNQGPFVPTAFTPNGDGHNDVFRIEGLQGAEDFYIGIFDRWGNLIFETKDPNFVWEGKTSDLDAPEGVYAMKYRAKDCKGEARYVNGSITLIR